MKDLLQILAGSSVMLALTCSSLMAMGIQIRDGRPVVDGVYINGQGPYRFLVDTGATLNHLDARIAKKIGLKEAFQTRLTSSTGVVPAGGATGIGVVLDSVRADDQTFLFAGVEAVQLTWPDVMGILGQEFLAHFDYFLDMRAKRLEFGRRESCGNTKQTTYKIDHGRPIVSTSLGWLVLDSGTNRLTRFGVKATAANVEMRTMTGTVKLGTVSSTLTIANHTFWHGDAITIPQSAESSIDGMLPASIFKSVYVSNSERFVAFE
jgi:hypothetical protein